MKQISKSFINNLAYKIVGTATEVHKEMGSGLLEDIYKDCIILELKNNGIFVEVERKIDIYYKGLKIKKLQTRS